LVSTVVPALLATTQLLTTLALTLTLPASLSAANLTLLQEVALHKGIPLRGPLVQAVSGAELLGALREGAAGTTFADISGGELTSGGVSVGAHDTEEGCCR
jgi:hypothetical protein